MVANSTPVHGSVEVEQQASERALILRHATFTTDYNDCNSTTTYKSRINGSYGNISISIPATTTGIFRDTTHEDHLIDGDLLCMELVSGGGAGDGIFYRTCLETVHTSAPANRYRIGSFTVNQNLTRYFCLTSLGNFSSDTSSVSNIGARTRMRSAGTVKNISIYVEANSLSASSTFRIRKNGANGTSAVTIPAGVTGRFSDTSGTDSIASGDDFCYQLVTGAGGTSLSFAHMTCEYETTNGNTVFVWVDNESRSFNEGWVNQPFGSDQAQDFDFCAWFPHTTLTAKNYSLYVSANTLNDDFVAISSVDIFGSPDITVTGATTTTGWFEDTTHSIMVKPDESFLMVFGSVDATSGAFTPRQQVIEIEPAYTVLLDGGVGSDRGMTVGVKVT